MIIASLPPGKRDLEAPQGEAAAIFDWDGTIAECHPLYQSAKELFGHFMERCGFDRQQAMHYFREAEIRETEGNAFDRHHLSRPMIDAYQELCREHGRQPKDSDIDICKALGQGPFFQEPVVFENAVEVLNELRKRFRLFVVTIGDTDVQGYKVKKSGLKPLFDKVIISSRRDKDARVAKLMQENNLDPRHCVFVGNSPRSDGITLKVTNFIHQTLEGGLVFEMADLPQNTGFQSYTTADWLETYKVFQELIRRRDLALGRPAA